MCCSHKKHHKWIPLFIVLGIGLAFLAGWVVQLLWNATITEIFGSDPITYWQGVMILILSKILFGAKMKAHHDHKKRIIKRKFHHGDEECCTEKEPDKE